jgi:L-iditol 2-dehydrogenase
MSGGAAAVAERKRGLTFMLQAVMTKPGQIEFRVVPRPAVQAGEVLIQVKRIGVCGSDIHVYHGLHPYTSYPVVQGHEVSGVIAETGADVSTLRGGDKVVLMPQVTCGACYPCRHGQYHICDLLKVRGFQTGGAAQEYFSIPAAAVLKVPENVSLEQAALVEPIAVAVHALARAGDVRDKKVVVLGAGTIGNLVGQVARASGAAAVLLTDVSAYKLEKARQCGFTQVVNTRETDLSQAIALAFGPDKADLMLECVGVQDTITQAVANARKGSPIVVVGVFGEPPRVDLGLVQDRELTLLGTLMYQQADFEQALALVAGGALHLDDLVTHRFAFRDYLRAYQTIESARGDLMKVMIELN